MEDTRIGPFLIQEKLGSNRHHRVYRAIQLKQKREVAIKFIHVASGAGKPNTISRIKREARILKQLSHPNLTHVHGAGTDGSKIFFAMEIVIGETLSSILQRRGKLAWELACDYARQIACCLEYLNSQELVHLKLTPEKILITPEGRVKIVDFRLNRPKKRRRKTVRKKSMDAAAYLAPEQFSEHHSTVQTDFYTLGVILFEMLTSKLPHTANSLQALGRFKLRQRPPLVSEYTLECPIWLDKIVSQLLANQPDKRPYSARSIIHMLDEIRRADREGTGVAEKIVSGFSPLTIGKDKSEARKALGIKLAKRKEEDKPLIQQTGFLVSAFIGVVALMLLWITYTNWPLTPSQLMDKANRLA